MIRSWRHMCLIRRKNLKGTVRWSVCIDRTHCSSFLGSYAVRSQMCFN